MAPPRVILATPIILTMITALLVMLYVSPSVATENIEIMSKYVSWNPSQVQYEVITITGMMKRITVSNFWEIIITIRNKGESEASIKDVLINHIPPSDFKLPIICITKVDDNPSYLTYEANIKPGENVKLTIIIPFQGSNSEFSHGKLIEIRIRTQTKERAIVLTLP